MRKPLLCTFLLVASQLAQAEDLGGKVTRIYPNAMGINFRLEGTCKASSNSAYFYFPLSSDLSKAWYAMLLSAASSGQPVRISLPQPCDPAVNQQVSYVYQNY